MKAHKTGSANTSTNRWNVPRLLVPVDVQALVVSKQSLNLPWAWKPLKYNNANKFLDVAPSMFGAGEQPGVGITLHWAMPDGLTQGLQNDVGEIVYPYAPNRWLITRFWGGLSKSWVLQSDYLDPKNGANLFLDPQSTQPVLTRIGKIWEIAQWPGEGGVTQHKFLQAIGPGTTTFAAYVPGIKGVFSFYDDMKDIADVAVPVTYMVEGWYGEPEDDPMLGTALFGANGFQTLDQWNEVMDRLKWTVGNETDLEQAVNDWKTWATAHGITFDPNKPRDVLPSQTLCQGMVYDVKWEGINGASQSGVPKYNPGTPADELPMVAIGNTSIDALSALVQYELDLDGGTTGQGAAEFLEAFQYHQLSTYDTQEGETKLYNEIFKAWFGSQDGPKVWLVRDPANPDPPVLSSELTEDLREINAQEVELNEAQRMLHGAQVYLYGLWWKQGKANTYWPDTYPPGIKTQAEWDKIKADIAAAIPGAEADVRNYQLQVDSLTSSIEALLVKIRAELTSPLVLDENTGSRYWQSNDPVFLIYGAKRSYRHGEDGRFDDDGKLFTRFTGQTVTGILVQIPNYTPPLVNASNISIPIVANPNNYFPPETADLCVETFFFDTGNAEAIAKEAATLLSIPFQASYTQIVSTQQTAAWNASIYNINPQVVADVSGIVGTIPSKVAVDPWQPPWSPLYLAWEIIWYPSYELPVDAMKKWTYDETSYEYQWIKANDPSAGIPVVLSGNTLLTPKGAFAMEAQLDEYLDETGEQPALRDFLEIVGNWDFLSQSLSGLSDQLLGLSSNQLNQPIGTIGDLVKSQTQLSPIPDETSKYFYPVRAGHFRINKLWVVDDFGQVFDPISARGEVPANFRPVLGGGLTTEGHPTLVQLPPRLTQPACMDFQFLAGSGAQGNSDDVMVNPVCGWLLPNHLDKGLMLYADDGTLLAELLLMGTTGNLSLRLDFAPGKNTPVGTPLAEVITNEYLRGFVEGLFVQPDPAEAFIALLSVIDETLWTINPLGGRNNELTAVLIGRPLALIRSGLKYHLSGGSQYNEQWKVSAQKNSGDYEKISLPVQLGNTLDPQDGTIGYFLGSDFTKFSTLLSAQAPANDYIVNRRVPLRPDSDTQDVTMIVDPRGSLTAISGILPLNQLVVPAVFIEDPLSEMEVTFRTGPLLVDPDQLRMPLPTEINGAWSWIQHSGVTTWETIDDIAQANQQARFSPSITLREGWLQLAGLFEPEEEK